MSFLRFWILLRLRRGQCRLTPLWLFASWLHCDYWHHGSIVIIDTRTPLWLSTSWLHCDYRHLFQISNTELVRLTSIIWVIVKTFPIELCLLSTRFLDGIYKRLIFSMYQLYKKKKKKGFHVQTIILNDRREHYFCDIGDFSFLVFNQCGLFPHMFYFLKIAVLSEVYALGSLTRL